MISNRRTCEICQESKLLNQRHPPIAHFRSLADPGLLGLVAVIAMGVLAIMRNWRTLCSLSISLLALAALALAIASLARKGR